MILAPGANYKLRSVQVAGTWMMVVPSIVAHLKCGTNFGMLHVHQECSCCRYVTEQFYFFGMRDDDPIVQIMCPRLSRTFMHTVKLVLPTDHLGRFELQKGDAVSDTHILETAVSRNFEDPKEHTLEQFFKWIATRVALRATFKRLKTLRRRARGEDRRMLILRSLRNKVDEPTLRYRIVCMARLW